MMLCKVLVFPNFCSEAGLDRTVYSWTIAQCFVDALILHKSSDRENAEVFLRYVFCLEGFFEVFSDPCQPRGGRFLVVIAVG